MSTPSNQRLGITPGEWKVRDSTEVYGAGSFVGSTKGNGPLPPSIMAQCAADASLVRIAETHYESEK